MVDNGLAVGQDNVELLRTLYQRWESGDLVTVDAFHPQVEFVRIGSEYPGLAGRWRGRDEMWAAIVEWLRSWEHLRVEAERFYELDDRVLVLSREIARGKQTACCSTTRSATCSPCATARSCAGRTTGTAPKRSAPPA